MKSTVIKLLRNKKRPDKITLNHEPKPERKVICEETKDEETGIVDKIIEYNMTIDYPGNLLDKKGERKK